MSWFKEHGVEIVIYALLFALVFASVGYSIYDTLNQKSFDSACDAACGEARSATPIIDFRNQCLCNIGHGKWQVTDVRAD